jgi:hypothetical protein
MERVDLVGRTIAAVGRAPGGAQLRCCLEVGVRGCLEVLGTNGRQRALLLLGTSGRRRALRVDVPASAWRCSWCAAAWRCWERAAGDVRSCCLGRRAPGGAGRVRLRGSWRCWQPVAGDVRCCWGWLPRLSARDLGGRCAGSESEVLSPSVPNSSESIRGSLVH